MMQSSRHAVGTFLTAAMLTLAVATLATGSAVASDDAGESAFPDATAFLASKGYAPEEYTVLLMWQEVAREGSGQVVRGYRLGPVNGKEPFDLYSDAAGNLLSAQQLAALGVKQKDWDLRPAAADAEVPTSLAKAVVPRPVPKGVALDVSPVEELVLPPIDLEAVLDEDWMDDDVVSKGRKRIGVPQELSESVQVRDGEANFGQWQALPDGASLWSLYVFSPDAKGQRVHFSEIDVPEGATVVVYNPDDPNDACGPFDGSEVWSPICFGDTVVVECHVPADADKSSVRLTIDKTIHIYKNLSDVQWTKQAGTCNLDVTCYSAWSTTALGIALISFVDGGSYVCSGSLIADTDPGTETPYFLTANHCISTQTVANTIDFYWLYQTASCNGSAPNLALVPSTTGGADFLASLPTPPSPGNDFALLRMRTDPPAGLTYVGWSTTTPSISDAVTCIHHPSGDYKRISFGSVTDTADTNLIEVVWSEGTTEGGSSGSPLMYSSDQKIIGQLLGGYASCGNPTGEDYYGRFTVTYPIVQGYLDPASLYPSADFSSAAYSVDEDGGSVLITVELSEAPGSGNSATIDYATSNGTATAGSDYTSTSGTLSFGATDTSQSFSVPILDDSDIEGAEAFAVTLSDPSGCIAGDTNNPTSVVITDDDVSLEPVADFSQATYTTGEDSGSVVITVELDKAPGDGNVARVDYATIGDTATAGSDFTSTSGTLIFGPAETSQTFSVGITDDSTEESTETVSLALSNPDGCILSGVNNPATLEITDDDYVPRSIDFSQSTYTTTEGGAGATITVVLNAAPGTGRTVTVDYATADDTAVAGADYTAASGTLTFEASDTEQTFTVDTLDDSAVEATEMVALVLSDPSGGVLATKANHPASLEIEDDDAPVVAFSSASYGVGEGEGSVEITVTLSSAPGVTATVDYYSDGGTATPGSDYVAVSDTLTFGPTDTSKTFSVSVVDDLGYEGLETIRLHLANPSFCTLHGTLSIANIVVADNDEEGSVAGDVNGDLVVDAVDIQLCVNGALGMDVGSAQTDQNGDSKTDAVDIQLVINAVLGL